jgi:hypothetical protein
MLAKFAWAVKQLLPLTYRSHFQGEEGESHFTVWKMWMGCCYKQDDIIIHHAV